MFVTSSQGSGVLPIVCDQKFKGLNFRLFSLSKKKDSVADGNSTVSSTPVIRRKAVVRLKDYPDKHFLVLAVTSKHYNKFYGTCLKWHHDGQVVVSDFGADDCEFE